MISTKTFKGPAGMGVLYPNAVRLAGRFTGTGAVVTGDPVDTGVTITLGATGVFTFTLRSRGGVASILTARVSVGRGDRIVQVRTIDAATGTVVAEVHANSSPTYPLAAVASNNLIMYEFWILESRSV